MQVILYDTTLRDGSQGEGVQFTVDDKLKVAKRLDQLGVHYIEGGWPGANPRDVEFFQRARGLKLRKAKLTAFGSTCRPKQPADTDPVLNQLIAAQTPVVAIFGKSWGLHVTQVLQTNLPENLRMIKDSISFLKVNGREVVYDAEHFFDGYRNDAEYALATLRAAWEGGADWIVLCDTNGGTMPMELAQIVTHVKELSPVPIGIHAHNDCGLAVANSVVAVQQGAAQVQGTFNGYGERCGNANLVTIIPNLQLKLGYKVLSTDNLSKLASTSRFICEMANMVPNERQPYVGKSAFAHKAGMHADGVIKVSQSFEHINPTLVGNNRRILVSDQGGRGNVLARVKRYSPTSEKNSPEVTGLLNKLKDLEHKGYQFEAAEGSLDLLIKKELGIYRPNFDLMDFRLLIAKDAKDDLTSEAIVKILVNHELVHVVSNGSGPVNALDKALRKALEPFFPILKEMELDDYKVRVIDGSSGTGSLVKVLIDTRYHGETWGTVGVSENIMEASIQALVDSLEYGIMTYGADAQIPNHASV